MYRTARKVVVLILGASIALVGVAMLALPGPGLLVILGGLAILATEFVWARSLMRTVKARSRAAAARMGLLRRRG